MIEIAVALIYVTVILMTLILLANIGDARKLSDSLLKQYPKVSIIIPTRNEERNIANCLQSLTSLDYPELELIVVDGNSQDKTSQIVKEEFTQVKFIEEPPRPDGWVGKPWACHVGYQHASGEVLLFTDADTVHDKDSLKKLVATLLRETDGFLTIVTKQIFKKFWEYTLVIILQMIMFTTMGSRGTKGRHIANGQYMLFTREVYEEIGGHESVASAVIEDMELASILAKNGIEPFIYDTPDLVSVRMYTQFSELLEGFSKNLAIGAKTVDFGALIRSNMLFIWADGWIILLILSYFFPSNSGFLITVAIFGYVLYAIISIYGQYRLTQKVGLHMLFFPFYYLLYRIILIRSAYLVFKKKNVQWKGNTYSVS